MLRNNRLSAVSKPINRLVREASQSAARRGEDEILRGPDSRPAFPLPDHGRSQRGSKANGESNNVVTTDADVLLSEKAHEG